MKENNKNIL